MRYDLTAHFKTFAAKPTKQEAAKISRNLEPAYIESIPEFVEDMEQGVSWSPSLFDGSRSNANWRGQIILALDFDGGLTPEVAIERMQAYDITPSAWYPTFSDTTDHRKFRLLFFLNTLIKELDARNCLMNGLFAMYPEADRACKNPAHFFYGTNKQGEVLNEKAISLDPLFTVLESHKVKGDGRLRTIKPESRGASYFRKSGFSRSSYSNTIEATSKARNWDQEEYYGWLVRNKDSKEISWRKLESRVRIFHDFMHSQQRLSYAQLLGLAQNLAWMKGGQKIYEDRLRTFNATHTGNNPYPKDARFELMRIMNKYNKTTETAYYPQRLSNFSPYISDHSYRNLIMAERDLLDGIEYTEPIQRMSVMHAELYFEGTLDDVLAATTNEIFIFRLPTGIGKTRAIKDLEGVTLAFPTHNLKNEVYRDRANPDSATITPEFPVFSSNTLNEQISKLYRAGFFSQVYRILWDLKKRVIGDPYDQLLANKYIQENEAAKSSLNTVFTTHARALHTPYTHDTLIFDEDPLELLLEVGTLKIADLKKIKKASRSPLFGNYQTGLMPLQRYLEKVEDSEILTLPDAHHIDPNQEYPHVLSSEGIDSNLLQFLSCDFFYKDPADRDLIHYVKRQDLPTDKKIIILSATVPVEIYQQLYGQRVKVIDISDVTHEGTITQHTKISYSRNSLAKRLEEVNTALPDRPTITFKNFNNTIKNATPDMWFGNCSGYNQYTGCSINVLGTPHKHNAQYLLIGKALGVNVDAFNIDFRMQPVEWNGFRFNFNTFDNPQLQKIQLSLIESELIQAAGRARALREDVEVDIYANLPLRITQQFVDD